MKAAVKRHGFCSIDVESASDLEDLATKCLNHLDT